MAVIDKLAFEADLTVVTQVRVITAIYHFNLK